jgi:hypothetical protein
VFAVHAALLAAARRRANKLHAPAMREAPPFEALCRLHAVERTLLAALSGGVAAACLAWVATQVDAAAVAWPWPWPMALVGAAAAGAGLGWRTSAAAAAGTLSCRQSQWAWCEAAGAPEEAGAAWALSTEAVVTPRIDFGSWLLLTVRTPDGAVRWVTIGRRRAAGAWHPLRAALFAPRRHAAQPVGSEGAPQ